MDALKDEYPEGLADTPQMTKAQELMQYFAGTQGLKLESFTFQPIPDGSTIVRARIDYGTVHHIKNVGDKFHLGIVPIQEDGGWYLTCALNEHVFTFNSHSKTARMPGACSEAEFHSQRERLSADEGGEYPEGSSAADDRRTWDVVLTLNGIPYDTLIEHPSEHLGLFLQQGQPVAVVNTKFQFIALRVDQDTSFLEAGVDVAEFMKGRYPSWTPGQ